MTYQAFIQKYMGERVDVDHYPSSNPYQCVDLVKAYVKEVYGIPYGSFGDAINYWTSTHPAILKKFTKVSRFSAPRRGDIVVFGYGRLGHVALVDGSSALRVSIVEQNGGMGRGYGVGTDVVRFASRSKAGVRGYLRPKVVTTGALPMYYFVKRGDTLSSIAPRFGLTWQKLYAMNRAAIGGNPNKIKVAMKLRVN